MTQKVPVRVGSTVFYAEVASAGPSNVAVSDAFSFDEIKATISAIGHELTEIWATVKPDNAAVEFGISLEVKSGKLTSLLVEGEGSASLKVTLSWGRSIGTDVSESDLGGLCCVGAEGAG